MRNAGIITHNHGFSVIELLIAGGLAAGLALVTAQMTANQAKSQAANSQKTAFSQIQDTIRTTISNPSAMIWTSKQGGLGGTILLKCLNGSVSGAPTPPNGAGVPDPHACTHALQTQIDLFQTNNPAALTGFYDLTGKRLVAESAAGSCTIGGITNPQCMFQVQSSITPLCPNNLNHCQKPISINIDYSLTQVNKPAGMRAIPPSQRLAAPPPHLRL